jgi:cytochrome c-type biogenesis protein CcmH
MRLTLLSWLGAAFLLVAGIGAVASYVANTPETAGTGDMIPSSLSRSAADGDMLARLANYARSIQTGEPAHTPAPAPAAATAGQMLPDVNTMIERLAARLETTPEDLEGWRMLGWSYFNTGLYREAATAYAKAATLDPSSAELKLLYEEAKTKASEGSTLETQTGVTR